MPAVSRNNPASERFVNFSLQIAKDKNIVRSMDSFPMQLTATGFEPT